MRFDLVTKTGVSGEAAPADLTVSYDAATKSYTVSSGGRTVTFGQGDVTGSNSDETLYEKTDAQGRDLLTLVHIPYSGTTATQYVGMGYWQRSVVNGNQQDLDFLTFTYGLETAAGAMPRTGTAGYHIDVFGAVSAPGSEPRSFLGRGQFSVDFGAGIFSTHAYLSETELVSGDGVSGGGIELTGAGHLSSSDGTFSGNAVYGGWFGSVGGTLDGRFYGPTAQELGASFSGENANGVTVAGSFTGGLDSSVVPANLTLTNMTKPQLFYAQYGGGLVGQYNWQNSETFTLYPPTSEYLGGQFTSADKVASSNPNFVTYRKTFTGSYESQDVTLELYKVGSANSELQLTYAGFGHWSTAVAWGLGTQPRDLYFTYGLETPARLLSARTGTGRYEGVVYGVGENRNSGLRYSVTGTSLFNVNFGTQSLTGALTLAGTSPGAASINFGSFDFGGPLSIYMAQSTFKFVHGTDWLGEIETRFYGPDGEEIAGPFSVVVPLDRPGGGTAITGVTAAARQ
jgi:hypothetical protein